MGITLNNNTSTINTNKEKECILQYFSAEIELDELSISEKNIKDNKIKAQDFDSLLVPLIRINDYILAANEIESLEIDCSGFLPKITLKALFAKNTFYTKNFVKDGDLISIAIRSKTDSLKIIRNDYIITNADCSEMFSFNDHNSINNSPYEITFFGELFIPKLESAKYDYTNIGTSFEMMQYIAKELKLGFASNESNTNDRQVWLSNNITPHEFITNILRHSWKDETSFFNAWIDIYYNLNFVNINKQLMLPEDDIDYGAFLSNADLEYLSGRDTSQSSTTVIPKSFTNIPQYEKSSFYISSWNPINNSSEITYAIGSSMYCNMFEDNINMYTSDTDLYWKLKVEPVYDKDKLNSHIILRGRSKYEKKENVESLARANYNFPDIYEKNPWMGIQYTCSDTSLDTKLWDGNQHKNYLRAHVNNVVNNLELAKLNININVNGLNQNIIIGDKLPVVLIFKNNLDAMEANQSPMNVNKLDLFYSGWYYVSGFTIKWNYLNNNGLQSNFTQTFTLTRREWPMPVPSLPLNENE